MTHASRDTTTGLKFEKQIILHKEGLNLTKNKLYLYLKEQGIAWNSIISRKLLPDEAYYDGSTLWVYEKKYQQTEGSADEKPQTCAFKIWEYRKIGQAMGAKDVKYIYIFNDWFKKPKYKDMLDFIRSNPGCDYYFANELEGV